ncbi:MAG: hypothetical protein LBR80_04720, partial [Deltaproteobacteria bacterium]|nr:hypothetical protein [Deltaproteobacteria bacterium]
TPFGETLRLNRAHLAFNEFAEAALNWIATLTAGFMLHLMPWADEPRDRKERAARRVALALRLFTAEGHLTAPADAGSPPALPDGLAGMIAWLTKGAAPGAAPEFVVCKGADGRGDRRKAIETALRAAVAGSHPGADDIRRATSG